MKKFIQKTFLTWKYSNDTMHITARKSVRIGIGLFLVLVGFFIFIQLKANHDYSFSQIDSSPKAVLSELESGKSRKITLVLYRDDCKYCKRIEKPLVKKIVHLKKETRKNVVVLNVKAMNTKQLNILKEKLPVLLVDGDKIPTPLVANLKVRSGSEIQVLSKSKTDELEEISSFIS